LLAVFIFFRHFGDEVGALPYGSGEGDYYTCYEEEEEEEEEEEGDEEDG